MSADDSHPLPEPSTIRSAVIDAGTALRAAGLTAEEARLDAAVLARHVLGWDQARYLAHLDESWPPGLAHGFQRLVARRARREPVSLITGRREFWGLDFDVTPAVLTPRPETELIVEEALACAAGAAPTAVVDVGTGSGCLAVCLAREWPEARIIATDSSKAALTIAGRNADRHGVAARIEFRHTSLLDGVPPGADLIVSNPPYIPTADIPSLQPEVRDHEPRRALDGGRDGLDLVRALLSDVPRVLARGGWFVMEFGFQQEHGLRPLIEGVGLRLVRLRADLQGIPRTLVARSCS